MSFLKLFQKAPVYLEAKVYLSSKSNSHLEIINKTDFISDKELILLAVLVYARILRVDSSISEKNKLVELFNEFYYNFKNVDDKAKFLDAMMTIFKFSSQPEKFNDTARIKLKKGTRNLFLDMGVIKVYPLSSVVFTVFLAVWKLVSESNKIHLIEAFTLLGKMYSKEAFTLSTAVDIPNEIVYEVIFGELK